jgi:putative membrane protein
MVPLTLDAILAIAHHLIVFSLVAMLVAEMVLADGAPDRARLQQLGRLDRAYGGLAGLALVAGGLRAVYGAKGWSFYAGNPLFWAKLGLFLLIGLLSIVPTVRLLRWQRAATLPDAATLRSTLGWMRAQAALLALIPVLAVLMARGIGH